MIRLKASEEALHLAGLTDEANRMGAIRTQAEWSSYATTLTDKAIQVAKERKVLDKLHILLYPKKLRPEHKQRLQKYGPEIIWLGKDADERIQDAAP